MKAKILISFLSILIALSGVGVAFAAPAGQPKPAPPKCVPAFTPGCN